MDFDCLSFKKLHLTLWKFNSAANQGDPLEWSIIAEVECVEAPYNKTSSHNTKTSPTYWTIILKNFSLRRSLSQDDHVRVFNRLFQKHIMQKINRIIKEGKEKNCYFQCNMPDFSSQCIRTRRILKDLKGKGNWFFSQTNERINNSCWTAEVTSFYQAISQTPFRTVFVVILWRRHADFSSTFV